MEFELMRDAIAKVLQLYESEITLDSSFEEDLGADSIDIMQMVRYIEQATGKKLELDQMNHIITVEDAVNWLKESLK